MSPAPVKIPEEPKTEAPAAPVVETPRTPRSKPRTTLISGASISELMGGTPSEESDEEPMNGEEADVPEVPDTDPDCARKLEVAREQILCLIQEKRPRFMAAFELVEFRDNAICLSVPTAELREEILRSKTEMLMRIAEIAEIRGMIELRIEISEQVQAVRPIKLEDRVKYLTEKNPLLNDLRKALDLDVE